MQELNIKGTVIRNTERGFDAAIMGTLFNKRRLDRKPLMMVVPKTVEDIIETIKYTRAIGKKISICSGGHSWSANHVRNDSVLINMSDFNSCIINKEAMTATAGPARATTRRARKG